jgi:hypothetical protein
MCMNEGLVHNNGVFLCQFLGLSLTQKHRNYAYIAISASNISQCITKESMRH